MLSTALTDDLWWQEGMMGRLVSESHEIAYVEQPIFPGRFFCGGWTFPGFRMYHIMTVLPLTEKWRAYSAMFSRWKMSLRIDVVIRPGKERNHPELWVATIIDLIFSGISSILYIIFSEKMDKKIKIFNYGNEHHVLYQQISDVFFSLLCNIFLMGNDRHIFSPDDSGQYRYPKVFRKNRVVKIKVMKR